MPLFKLCPCAHSVCVFVCVCVCARLHRDQQPFAVTGGLDGITSLLPLLLSTAEPQHLVSAGKPGKQSCGGGEGKDPHCCPSVLCWDEACDFHPVAGWVEVEGSQGEVPMAGKS